MRQVVFLAAAAGLLVAMPALAQTKERPRSDLWCRDQRIGPGPFDTVMICEAYTYAQCMASRTNFGVCYRNPRYQQRR